MSTCRLHVRSCVHSHVALCSLWTTGTCRQALLYPPPLSPGIRDKAQSSSRLGLLLFSSHKAGEESGRQSSRCTGLPLPGEKLTSASFYRVCPASLGQKEALETR